MADNAFSVNADGNSSGTADWGATCSRKGGSRKSEMEKLAGYCLLTFALLGALIRSSARTSMTTPVPSARRAK